MRMLCSGRFILVESVSVQGKILEILAKTLPVYLKEVPVLT